MSVVGTAWYMQNLWGAGAVEDPLEGVLPCDLLVIV